MRNRFVLILLLCTAPLAAQQPSKTVSPGMTKAQVVAALGEPATTRSAGGEAYLFYLNSCGKRCGMNDIVVLHGDSVVDAIFRAPDRHYTGKSSSPVSIPPAAAAKQKPSAAGAPLEVTGEPKPVRRMQPAPASDTRPSIPLNPGVAKPATPLTSGPPPVTKPAPKATPTTTKAAPTTTKATVKRIPTTPEPETKTPTKKP